jgi:hypothetical protein
MPEIRTVNHMSTMPTSRLRRRHPSTRNVMVTIAVASLALLTGCSAGAAPTSSSSPSSSSSGNVSSGNGPAGQGNQASSTFTLAFAKCMQTHGVPNFPDPSGQAGQLGPGSGVDPASPQFQSALNGPCLSLAPPAWVSSGKVTR